MYESKCFLVTFSTFKHADHCCNPCHVTPVTFLNLKNEYFKGVSGNFSLIKITHIVFILYFKCKMFPSRKFLVTFNTSKHADQSCNPCHVTPVTFSNLKNWYF